MNHDQPPYTPKELTTQNTHDNTEGPRTNLTHDELHGVRSDSNGEQTVTTVSHVDNKTTAKKPTGENRREKEKEPEATLLLSGYAKSGTNPSEWFDANAPGFKSIKDYSTPDFRYEVNRNHKGEREDFAWIECTEGDFRVYSCGGRRSRDEYKGLRGTGILAIRVEGVIIPFGLVKPQSLEQLDLNVPPEFKALEQLMKEYYKLLERRTEIQKTIAEIEAKMFGKFRSREKRGELEGLQSQIEQKESDISKARDALAKAEEKRSLNSYETAVTSLLLKAAKKPDSTIRGEIPLECGSFSALDWYKKIQELAKDES